MKPFRFYIFALIFPATVLPVSVSAGNSLPAEENRSLPTMSFVSDSQVKGDVNLDGKLNIFDLLALLTAIFQPPSYPTPADLDNSGKVDLLDLVELLNCLAEPEKEDEPLEYMMTMQDQVFGGHVISLVMKGIFTPDRECIPDTIGTNYTIYSNKEIKEVEFVLGADTMRNVSGVTPSLLSYEAVLLDSVEIIAPSAFLKEFTWSLRLEAGDGSRIDTNGTTVFELLYCSMVDYSVWRLTREIEFPMGLKGPLQRFLFCEECRRAPNRYSVYVDLNPGRKDSLVFNDIHSLADSLAKYTGIDVSPAVYLPEERVVNRLLFYWRNSSFGAWPIFYTQDDNEELLEKLGLPRWVRDIPYYLDINYFPY